MSRIDTTEIRREDIPPELADIADLLGVSAVVLLARLCGGSRVYVHKLETIFRRARNRKIRDAFNGVNYAELAQQWEIKERTVREIIHGPRGRQDDKN